MPQTTPALIPAHLGLILDGNRRWAKLQNMPTFEGHRKGYENLKTIVSAALDSGVEYVSAYIFSTENWNRSREEVAYLMKLLLWIAKNEVEEFNKNNVRVRFLGEDTNLSSKVIKAMRDAEAKTENNTGGTLLLCLNYGGKQEIARAATNIVIDNPGVKAITPEMIQEYLYEPQVPDLDLIIRTSGEQRISNFMLWRAAYSELYFVDVHWPAFTVSHLKQALSSFGERQRRFGS
jgi:undecaprenyl diphosphate synthase